ncbi:MAG: AI-2E family transporter [Chloroflexi bacterium]|nr:AI-2E family transporter [Chloroflexota bacterium]
MLISAGWTKWLALAAVVALLWIARGVLPPFIIAGILAYLLLPLVDEIEERLHIRHAFAALFVFAAFLAIIGTIGWLAGARLGDELRALSREGPSIIENVIVRLTGGQEIDVLGQTVTSRELGRRIEAQIQGELGTPSQAIQAIRTGVDITFGLILVVLALVYMLIDGHTFWRYWLRFVPDEHRAHVDTVSAEIHRVLGRYLRGQLVLIFLMSMLTFVVLEWGFRLPYALWIGFVTGVLEVIPLIGPFTAAAIASTVGFAQGGPTEAAGLIIVYAVLRQVEDQLVMPIVVGRAVHVHPLATIFAVVVGERMAGVLGMVLAVPVAAAIKVVLDYAYPRTAPRIQLPEGVALREDALASRPIVRAPVNPPS